MTDDNQGADNLPTDFLAKADFAYREAKETLFWVRLLRDSGFIPPEIAQSMLDDCEAILDALRAIRRSEKRHVLTNDK